MDLPRSPPPPPSAPGAIDGLNLAAGFLFVPALREFEQVAQDEVDDGLASAADTQAQLWVEAAQTDPEASKTVDVSFLNELLGLPGILERKLGVKNAKLDSRLAKQMGLKSVNFNSNFTTASAEASKYRKDVAEHSGAEAFVVRSRYERLLAFAAERGALVERRRKLQALEAGVLLATPPTVAPPSSASSVSSSTSMPAVSAPVGGAPAAAAKPAAPSMMPRKNRPKKTVDGKLLTSSDPRYNAIEVAMPDCNQLLLTLGDTIAATKNLQKMTGDPIYCKACNGALNQFSKIERAPPVALSSSEEISHWTCEFCGVLNTCRIDKEEMPQTCFSEYMIEPPQKGGSIASPLVIFCIDTSGSMCVTTEVGHQVRLPPALNALVEREKAEMRKFIEGAAAQWMPRQNQQATYVSRLQCVQAQIAKLRNDAPHTRVAIVLFNSEVVIIGDGSQTPVTLAGDVLSDYEGIMGRGSGFNAFQRPVSESYKDLETKIFEVESRGSTALGPALVVSAAIAANAPSAKIILCTDGKANVGLGNVDSTVRPAVAPARSKGPALPPLPGAAVVDQYSKARDEVESFYRKVGTFAKKNGSSVSVVSIRGDDCSMENLGLLADITGGQVDIVDPIDLEKNFAGMLAKPVLARATQVQLCLPKPFLPEAARDIGNVHADTDIAFTWSVKAPLDLSVATLPLQVQVRYTAPDGTKLLRVISRNLAVSQDRNKTEAIVDTAVVSINAIHKSAELAHKGDYQAARVNMVAAMHFIQRSMKNRESQRDYISFILQGEKLDGFMRIKSAQEVVAKKAGADVDRRAARDDAASKSIFQMKSLSKTAFKSQAL